MKKIVSSVMCIISFVGCASTSPSEENEAAAPGAADDLNVRVQLGAMSNQFTIVRDGSVASKATGSVEVPIRGDGGQLQQVSGYSVRGTCGVTFIAPHYAITAAHCIKARDVPDPQNAQLTVRTYDVTSASELALEFSSIVEGTFPNYSPSYMTAAAVPGYTSQAYACKVTARCGSDAYQCSVAGGADVAMLYCPTRAIDAAWLPIADDDPQSGPVEMYWFHELLAMPTKLPAAGAPATEFDRFAHYTEWSQDNFAKNFHYLSSPVNALLPLKSETRQRLGPNTSGTGTDLFGCHGTSGSGVFQRNAVGDLELLGPAATGSEPWGSTRLCNDPETYRSGTLGLSYTSNLKTRQLEAEYRLALRLDRLAIISPPGGGVFDPTP